MRIKYNRVSTLQQIGERFTADQDKYDLTLMDRVSGAVAFMDRPKGKELAKLIEAGTVQELVVEELSRLGRNTGDVIRTLEWMDDKNLNVVIRNLGLQSRPNGQTNPIWKLICSVMSSMYEMELANIRERTSVGLQIYLQKGGRLGRPTGSRESEADFLKKEQTVRIIKGLKKGLTIRDICKVVDASPKTVLKAKKVAIKYGKLT